MTIKEFIEQNPDATLDMMTPVGFLQFTPEQVAELFQCECVNAHPGDRESWAKVTMEELLPQEILHCKPHPHIPNYYYMFTAQEQEHGKEISQFAGTMQAKCWRGQHPFDWNDIAFEQEIIESDGSLNFYVPIYFDAYGIFGDAVSKLEPDDSYNVYANYDLEEGDVSEYLEIVVKYGDGHDDLAYYRLSPEEQEMFLRKMDAYCMEVGGKSLKDWELEFQQNQSSTAMTEAPQM